MSLIKNLILLGICFKVGSVGLRKIAYKFFLRQSIYKNGMNKFFANKNINLRANDNKNLNTNSTIKFNFIPGKLNFSINDLDYNADTYKEKIIYSSNVICVNTNTKWMNYTTFGILNIKGELEKINQNYILTKKYPKVTYYFKLGELKSLIL
jgi:hypothetical protein